MKLMLIGDVHGNERWLYQDVFPRAIAEGIDLLVSLGDWGMFWDTPVRMDRVQSNLDHRGLNLYFLDGNHENFDLMEDFGFFTSAEVYTQEVQGVVGPKQNSRWPNIWYLPRGSTFEYGGNKYMAFGGAVSIDKDYRIKGESWWPQELITDEQVQWVKDHPVEVDILLSHDVAGHPPGLMDFCQRYFNVPYKMDVISRNNRERLYEVAQVVKPTGNIHGHYHHPYKDRMDMIDYTGLARDGQRHSVAIIQPKNQANEQEQA